MMKNKGVYRNVFFMAQAAAIAAIYVVLTLVFAPFSFGEVQVRIAEALTILPIFTPAAVPGLFVGCLIGNVLGGALLPDIVFGSLATLIGAVFTWQLRDRKKVIACIPPVISYGVNLPIPFLMITVGIGEVISCMVLGLLLASLLEKYRYQIFRTTPSVR